MKAADLTVDELQALIRKFAHEELQSIMADPDQYLELTDEIQVRIESSLNSSDRISFQEVKNVTIQRKKCKKCLTGLWCKKVRFPIHLELPAMTCVIAA